MLRGNMDVERLNGHSPVTQLPGMLIYPIIAEATLPLLPRLNAGTRHFPLCRRLKYRGYIWGRREEGGGGEMRGFTDDCRRRYANVLPNRSGGKGNVWKMFDAWMDSA